MNRRYGIYYAAAAYLLYLVYGVISDIKNGVSDNVPFSVGIAVFFSVAALAIFFYAYKGTKAEKLAEEKKAAEARRRALAEDDAEEEAESLEEEENAPQDEDADESAEDRGGGQS